MFQISYVYANLPEFRDDPYDQTQLFMDISLPGHFHDIDSDSMDTIQEYEEELHESFECLR